MMLTLDQIQTLLQQKIGAPLARREQTLTWCASAADGFDVVLTQTTKKLILSYGEWSDWYLPDNAQMAAQDFLQGLSDQVRVVVTSRGGVDYQWRLESWVEGEWMWGSTVMVPNLRLWRRKQMRIVQNRLFQGPAPQVETVLED
ncbi:hypothetical protein [Magnetofaba australis]|uniref:Uncharacterized protein n=1 Tax=Magnetofaba australis IT-1 TaxID=1434232 RepID=A0A1Y2JZW2_9PROT|nr:hypothetical protein [Magnetofaba australis]OSM00470.1 hypothetical protein MAIT1_00995 [Magnetofaba australis IT-1]